MQFTLGTCSFNTPEVTYNMVRSFYRSHRKEDHPLVITENSTNDETSKLLDSKGIEYFRNKGMRHSKGVDVLLKNCTTKYMLLVDTDVIFLGRVSNLFNRFKESGAAICGVRRGNSSGLNLKDRILPWFCFIDVEAVNAKGIRFDDSLSRPDDVCLSRPGFDAYSKPKNIKLYDVGAAFYEDIRNAGHDAYLIEEEEQDNYIIHFHGMSWRKNSGIDNLVQAANQVETEYAAFINNLESHGMLGPK